MSTMLPTPPNLVVGGDLWQALASRASMIRRWLPSFFQTVKSPTRAFSTRRNETRLRASSETSNATRPFLSERRRGSQ